jgi:hypothetical protein
LTEHTRDDSNCASAGIGRYLLTVEKTLLKAPIYYGAPLHSKYILWESSGVTEQYAVVQFLELKKLSLKVIKTELKGVHSNEARSFGGEDVVQAFR